MSDFDDDDTLDDLDDDFGFDELAGDDAPERSAARAVADGAIDKVLDVESMAGVAGEAIKKNALPSGYQDMVADIGGVQNTARQIYDQVEKDMKPAVNGVKSLIRANTSFIEKVLPESFAKRVNDFAGDAPEYQDVINQEEVGIQSTLADIFDQNAKMTASNAEVDGEVAKVDAIRDIKQHQETQATSLTVAAGVQKLVGYQDSILINYQRKHLELQHRIYFANRDLVNLSKAFFDVAGNLLKNIQKNTGLPDVVKYRMSERLGENMSDRMYGKVADKVGDFTSQYGAQMQQALMDKVSNATAMVNTGINTAVDGASQSRDTIGALSATQRAVMGGELGGELAASVPLDMGARRIRKYIEGNDKLMGLAKAYKNISDNGASEMQAFVEGDKTLSETGIAKRLGGGLSDLVEGTRQSVENAAVKGVELLGSDRGEEFNKSNEERRAARVLAREEANAERDRVSAAKDRRVRGEVRYDGDGRILEEDRVTYSRTQEFIRKRLQGDMSDQEFSESGKSEMFVEMLDKLANKKGGAAGAVDLIGNFAKGLAPTFHTETTLAASLADAGGEAAVFDIMTHRSINTIIPGYLSRILEQTTVLATGSTVDRVVYSAEREGFTTVSEQDRALRDKLFSAESVTKSNQLADKAIRAIDKDNTLSSEARLELKERLINQRDKRSSFVIDDFREDTNQYAAKKYTSESVGKEITNLLDTIELENRDEDHIAEINSNYRYMDTRSDAVDNVISRSSVMDERESLERMGILTRTGIVDAYGRETGGGKLRVNTAALLDYNSGKHSNSARFTDNFMGPTTPVVTPVGEVGLRNALDDSTDVSTRITNIAGDIHLSEDTMIRFTDIAGMVAESVENTWDNTTLTESVNDLRNTVEAGNVTTINTVNGVSSGTPDPTQRIVDAIRTGFRDVRIDNVMSMEGVSEEEGDSDFTLRECCDKIVSAIDGNSMTEHVLLQSISQSTGITAGPDNATITPADTNTLSGLRSGTTTANEMVSTHAKNNPGTLRKVIRVDRDYAGIIYPEGKGPEDYDKPTTVNPDGSPVPPTIRGGNAAIVTSMGNPYASITGALQFDNLAKRASKMGKGAFDTIKEAVKADVFVIGRKDPVLTARGMEEGAYADKASGKVIETPEDIAGPVIDTQGNEVVTNEDIVLGLETNTGSLAMKLAKASLRGIGKAWALQFKMINYGLVKPLKYLTKGMYGVSKRRNKSPVFIKGEREPRLVRRGFKQYDYYSTVTGKAVKNHGGIDGPVVNRQGEYLITEEDLDKGLVSRIGTKIHTNKKFAKKLRVGGNENLGTPNSLRGAIGHPPLTGPVRPNNTSMAGPVPPAMSDNGPSATERPLELLDGTQPGITRRTLGGAGKLLGTAWGLQGSLIGMGARGGVRAIRGSGSLAAGTGRALFGSNNVPQSNIPTTDSTEPSIIDSLQTQVMESLSGLRRGISDDTSTTVPADANMSNVPPAYRDAVNPPTEPAPTRGFKAMSQRASVIADDTSPNTVQRLGSKARFAVREAASGALSNVVNNITEKGDVSTQGEQSTNYFGSRLANALNTVNTNASKALDGIRDSGTTGGDNGILSNLRTSVLGNDSKPVAPTTGGFKAMSRYADNQDTYNNSYSGKLSNMTSTIASNLTSTVDTVRNTTGVKNLITAADNHGVTDAINAASSALTSSSAAVGTVRDRYNTDGLKGLLNPPTEPAPTRGFKAMSQRASVIADDASPNTVQRLGSKARFAVREAGSGALSNVVNNITERGDVSTQRGGLQNLIGMAARGSISNVRDALGVTTADELNTRAQTSFFDRVNTGASDDSSDTTGSLRDLVATAENTAELRTDHGNALIEPPKAPKLTYRERAQTALSAASKSVTDATKDITIPTVTTSGIRESLKGIPIPNLGIVDVVKDAISALRELSTSLREGAGGNGVMANTVANAPGSKDTYLSRNDNNVLKETTYTENNATDNQVDTSTKVDTTSDIRSMVGTLSDKLLTTLETVNTHATKALEDTLPDTGILKVLNTITEGGKGPTQRKVMSGIRDALGVTTADELNTRAQTSFFDRVNTGASGVDELTSTNSGALKSLISAAENTAELRNDHGNVMVDVLPPPVPYHKRATEAVKAAATEASRLTSVGVDNLVTALPNRSTPDQHKDVGVWSDLPNVSSTKSSRDGKVQTETLIDNSAVSTSSDKKHSFDLREVLNKELSVTVEGLRTTLQSIMSGSEVTTPQASDTHSDGTYDQVDANTTRGDFIGKRAVTNNEADVQLIGGDVNEGAYTGNLRTQLTNTSQSLSSTEWSGYNPNVMSTMDGGINGGDHDTVNTSYNVTSASTENSSDPGKLSTTVDSTIERLATFESNLLSKLDDVLNRTTNNTSKSVESESNLRNIVDSQSNVTANGKDKSPTGDDISTGDGVVGDVSIKGYMSANLATLREIRDADKKVAGDGDGDGIRDGSYLESGNVGGKGFGSGDVNVTNTRNNRTSRWGSGNGGLIKSILGAVVGIGSVLGDGLGAIVKGIGALKLATLMSGKGGDPSTPSRGYDGPEGNDRDTRRGNNRPNNTRRGFFGKMIDGVKKVGSRAGSFMTRAAVVRGVMLAGTYAASAGTAMASAGTAIATAAATVSIGAIAVAAGAVLAVGALAYGAYLLYKHIKRGAKVEPLEGLRFYQHGLDPTDKEFVYQIRILEELVQDNVTWSDTVPVLSEKPEYYYKEVHEGFGRIKEDPADRDQWIFWFRKRFVPVLFTHLCVIKDLQKGVSLSSIDSDMDTVNKIPYLARVQFTDSDAKANLKPYSVIASPMRGHTLQSNVSAIIALTKRLLEWYSTSDAKDEGGDYLEAFIPKAVPDKYKDTAAVHTTALEKQRKSRDEDSSIKTPSEILAAQHKAKNRFKALTLAAGLTTGVGLVEDEVNPRLEGGKTTLIMPTKGRLSSKAGMRIHPIEKTKSVHKGIDIAAPNGSPILAAADGEIFRQAYSKSYGNVIYMKHADGTATRYAHMTGFAPGTGLGVKVRQGSLIGYVGDTGKSAGNHLHFEWRKTTAYDSPWIDPLKGMVEKSKRSMVEAVEEVKRAGLNDDKELTDGLEGVNTLAVASADVVPTTSTVDKVTGKAMPAKVTGVSTATQDVMQARVGAGIAGNVSNQQYVSLLEVNERRRELNLHTLLPAEYGTIPQSTYLTFDRSKVAGHGTPTEAKVVNVSTQMGNELKRITLMEVNERRFRIGLHPITRREYVSISKSEYLTYNRDLGADEKPIDNATLDGVNRQRASLGKSALDVNTYNTLPKYSTVAYNELGDGIKPDTNDGAFLFSGDTFSSYTVTSAPTSTAVSNVKDGNVHAPLGAPDITVPERTPITPIDVTNDVMAPAPRKEMATLRRERNRDIIDNRTYQVTTQLQTDQLTYLQEASNQRQAMLVNQDKMVASLDRIVTATENPVHVTVNDDNVTPTRTKTSRADVAMYAADKRPLRAVVDFKS